LESAVNPDFHKRVLVSSQADSLFRAEKITWNDWLAVIHFYSVRGDTNTCMEIISYLEDAHKRAKLHHHFPKASSPSHSVRAEDLNHQQQPAAVNAHSADVHDPFHIMAGSMWSNREISLDDALQEAYIMTTKTVCSARQYQTAMQVKYESFHFMFSQPECLLQLAKKALPTLGPAKASKLLAHIITAIPVNSAELNYFLTDFLLTEDSASNTFTLTARRHSAQAMHELVAVADAVMDGLLQEQTLAAAAACQAMIHATTVNLCSTGKGRRLYIFLKFQSFSFNTGIRSLKHRAALYAEAVR
jgi:hypothetical protein